MLFVHGRFGVALFFMLSGFILYYTYADNLETGRDLYKFFVARVARLYPIYFLALVLSAILQWQLPHGKQLLIFPMLQSWSLEVSSLGNTWVMQAWTLSVETFFYCSFPLLLLLLRRRWNPTVVWVATAILLIGAGLTRVPCFHPGAPSTWISNHMITPVLCLPEFAIGMLLGWNFLRRQQEHPEAVTNDWITLAGIAPCLAVFMLVPTEGRGMCLVLLFCFAWSIYRLGNGRGWLTRFLSTEAMLLLGGASYAVYLLQGPVRTIVHNAFARLHPGLDAAISPFVLIGGSCLLFLYYEEPLRNVIRVLLTRPEKPAA